jgi:hypothetical protein
LSKGRHSLAVENIENLDLLYEVLDGACVHVPAFLSWSCDENAKSFLAITIILIVFFSAFSVLFSLKATKFTYQKIKYFFVRSISQAYENPMLTGWTRKLSPLTQLWLFRVLGAASGFISLISSLYAFLFLYPVIFSSSMHMRYGLISYLGMILFGSFMAFYCVVSFGMSMQYFQLVSAAKMQLNKALNRTRKKQRAG